jgi:hypothetical protein
MTDTKQKQLKDKIIALVQKSGVPIRAQYIAKQMSMPDNADMTTLLTELVDEGRLIRRPTLLASGEVGYIYDVLPTR